MGGDGLVALRLYSSGAACTVAHQMKCSAALCCLPDAAVGGRAPAGGGVQVELWSPRRLVPAAAERWE